MRIPFYDLVAGAVTVLLLVGVLALVGLDRAVPEYLSNALTLTIGVSLRGGVGVANDWSHRNRKS